MAETMNNTNGERPQKATTAADAQEKALRGAKDIKDALTLAWHKMAVVQQNLAGKMPYPDWCAEILDEISESLRYCCEDLDTVSEHVVALGAFPGGHLKAMTGKGGKVVSIGDGDIAGKPEGAVSPDHTPERAMEGVDHG